MGKKICGVIYSNFLKHSILNKGVYRFMQQAEVSLRVALHFIMNGITKENVKVSLDGAHIKTGNQVHFDIFKFLSDNQCHKLDLDGNRWQGIYQVQDFDAKLEIVSSPGIGDVNIKLPDGKSLYVESKKGRADKKGQKYPLMREAIGQLMTGVEITESIVPVVAVPFSEKSYELATRGAKLEQIKNVGIKFFLVKEEGKIVVV